MKHATRMDKVPFQGPQPGNSYLFTVSTSCLSWWCLYNEISNEMALSTTEMYFLWKVRESEQEGQFINSNHIWWIWHHLQAGRWRGKAIHQQTPHAMSPVSPTSWKVKGEGNWSTHAACNESNITYKLEGGRQFVSQCHMQWIWCHWLAGRLRRKAICQPTLHVTNLTPLTCWKVKGEGVTYLALYTFVLIY